LRPKASGCKTIRGCLWRVNTRRGRATFADQEASVGCPDQSLRARWRRSLVAVGLGRAFERIGGGLCRLSRIGGSVRCQVVGGGFAGGR
jgi:hypothetical protein